MSRRSRERGAVTAETAVALPGLVLVAVLCVWAVLSLAVHLRCIDAARLGARELARGEPPSVVVAVTRAQAPEGARVRLSAAGPQLVTVRVTARVPLLWGWRGGPELAVGGAAVAAAESAGRT
jgi:hypothetical protein